MTLSVVGQQQFWIFKFHKAVQQLSWDEVEISVTDT